MARGLSSCGSRAVERRLSSCGTLASLLRGMWDLPGPGLEPMSPALAGGFLTTPPPEKSLKVSSYKDEARLFGTLVCAYSRQSGSCSSLSRLREAPVVLASVLSVSSVRLSLAVPGCRL